MAVVNLTADRVLAWRAGRQFLDRPAGTNTVTVAERLVGVQAEAPPVPADRLAAEVARVRSYPTGAGVA